MFKDKEGAEKQTIRIFPSQNFTGEQHLQIQLFGIVLRDFIFYNFCLGIS
jgi:hypothetical protein